MNRPPLQITSPRNDRAKAVFRLRTARERRRQKRTLIEEPLVLRRALASGVQVVELWFCPERESAATATLRSEIAPTCPETFEAAPEVLDRLSYRDRSEGLLAVVEVESPALADLELPTERPALMLVVESLEKPGNLGAVQRIADGAGADAVLICGEGVEPWNPNVLRASRGACFRVPCPAAPAPQIVQYLGQHGIRIVATTPDTATQWSEADLTGPVAIVLGAEHDGLSEFWLEKADQQVALPMNGIGDSLNISTTAAILLYECVRQRTATKANK